MFLNSMMRRAKFFPALLVALAALTVSGCEKPPEQALGTLEWDRVNNRIPASEIIIDRLILEAKRLLIYSDLNNKEVAYELNYEDPSYFARIFRRKTGLTPSAFRKQTRERYR